MKFTQIAAGLGLSLVFSAAAAAQDENPRRMANTITVNGSGESNAAPDIAYVTVGVSTTGRKAQDAAQANAAATQKVMSALLALGIAKKDLQTSGYSVNPTYDPQPRPNEGPRITGYQVSNTVRATIRDLANIGKAIDAALEAGANNVHGVSFGLEAKEKADSEALTNAVAEARRKADVLARAAGVQIKGVLLLQEGMAYRPMPVMETAMFRGAARAETPISPGELTVTANVTVVYSILPAAGAAATPEDRAAAGAEVKNLLRRRSALLMDIAALKTRYRGTHPVVRARAAELNTLEALIEGLKNSSGGGPREPRGQ